METPLMRAMEIVFCHCLVSSFCSFYRTSYSSFLHSLRNLKWYLQCLPWPTFFWLISRYMYVCIKFGVKITEDKWHRKSDLLWLLTSPWVETCGYQAESEELNKHFPCEWLEGVNLRLDGMSLSTKNYDVCIIVLTLNYRIISHHRCAADFDTKSKRLSDSDCGMYHCWSEGLSFRISLLDFISLVLATSLDIISNHHFSNR